MGFLERNRKSNSKNKYIKNLFTRILLSIILLLSIGIFIKTGDRNIMYIQKYFFEDSIEFTKINNWYHDNIGKIIPDVSNNTAMVLKTDNLLNIPHEEYKDGIKIEVEKSCPISIIASGIVVYIGDKEGYGNTLIIQGNDGIDYWYGNIDDKGIGLYDYLEKDTIVGESKDNYITLLLYKDGEVISYNEYIKKDKS